jgi:predicted metallo-beta-lactamase superfamily hydrolase
MIRVTPIGFESLGVRSMCTFVETPDVRVLIDAGVALGPRFGRLPHPKEYQARNTCRAKIREYASKADLIIVSHYHNDHHTPNYTETVWLGSSVEESEQIYKDKLVVAKSVRDSINFSQRRRGWMFQQFLKKIGATHKVADGEAVQFGTTMVRISQPVPHGGEGSELGWVLMTTIETDEMRFIHSSDVQGPVSKQTSRMILKEQPDLLILGGPPVYLQGSKVAKGTIASAFTNATRIANRIPTVIFDHHILRSAEWKDSARSVFDAGARASHRVVTAAEYAGLPTQLLEAVRQTLYEQDPPSPEFLKWSKLKREKQRLELPPIDN